MKSKSKSSSLNVIAGGMEAKWRAESDLDTLMRACEIKADAKRLKAAMALADERKQSLVELQEDAKEESTESKAERAKEKTAGDAD
jgi:hypothetical protein